MNQLSEFNIFRSFEIFNSSDMQKLWNYISNFGIDRENREIADRSVVISNQLNFVLLIDNGVAASHNSYDTYNHQ